MALEWAQTISIPPVWCLVLLEIPDLLTFTFVLRTLVMCVYEPFIIMDSASRNHGE